MAIVGGGYDIVPLQKKNGQVILIFGRQAHRRKLRFEAGMHCHCLVGGINSMIEQEFVHDTRNEIEYLSTLYKIVPHSILIRAISGVGGVSE